MNPDKSLRIPSVFTVPLGEDEVTFDILGTKDSISFEYGNGYNLCGPRVYEIYAEGENVPFENDSFTITKDKSFDADLYGADEISFSLLSFEEGPIMAKKVRFYVYL